MATAVPMIVLLSRRESLAHEDFRAYWQDVHGPLAARLPGLHHYRQLHLAWARGWWPEDAGTDLGHPGGDAVDGIADMAFASVEGQQAYAEVAHFTRNDEVNLFRRSVRYMTDESTADEAAARIASALAQSNGFRLCVLLRRRPGCPEAAFAKGIRDLFAPLAATQCATVWILAPRDNTRNHLLAAHVDHDAPEHRQYQAMVELAFGSAAEARRLLLDDPGFAERQRPLVGAAHVYRVDQVAPMLLQGRMTPSGRRGHTVAQLIARAGAVHQLDDAVAAKFGERPQ
jgi:hypothetical protein